MERKKKVERKKKGTHASKVYRFFLFSLVFLLYVKLVYVVYVYVYILV